MYSIGNLTVREDNMFFPRFYYYMIHKSILYQDANDMSSKSFYSLTLFTKNWETVLSIHSQSLREIVSYYLQFVETDFELKTLPQRVNIQSDIKDEFIKLVYSEVHNKKDAELKFRLN